jgi:Zn finger protein HypA/HybF involved in hydrogenase expression
MNNSTKVKEWCQDCGKVFLGGANAFLCPKCRRKRVEEGKRKHREKKVNDNEHVS